MAGLPDLNPSDDGARADWRALEALEVLEALGQDPREVSPDRRLLSLAIILSACMILSENPPRVLGWAIEAQTSASLREMSQGLADLTGAPASIAVAETRAVQIAGLTVPIQISLAREERIGPVPDEVLEAVRDWCAARARERGYSLERFLGDLASDLLHLADRQREQVGYVILLALLALPAERSPSQTLNMALEQLFPVPPQGEAT